MFPCFVTTNTFVWMDINASIHYPSGTLWDIGTSIVEFSITPPGPCGTPGPHGNLHCTFLHYLQHG